MTDKTLGIIYALKQSGLLWNHAVAAYMSIYSNTPVREYSETVINDILEETFIDYISTCDDPTVAVRELFERLNGYGGGTRSLGSHIASVLIFAKVQDGSKWVNGFRKLSEDIKRIMRKIESNEYYYTSDGHVIVET